MKSVNPYLTFNGNCREAMLFYQQCLGGDLFFQTVGDSPSTAKLPLKMKRKIVHSTLTAGQLVLMGSDMVSNDGLIKGNAASLLLNFSNKTEAKKCFSKLAIGAVATYPLQVSSWGTLFGNLTDKYGHHWLLHYEKGLR